VGNAQTATTPVPRGKAERHETALDASLAQKSVDRAQHVRGPRLLRPQAAYRADGHGSIERRRASLSAHVAQRERKFLRAVSNKVVKVAAQFARRDNARRDV